LGNGLSVSGAGNVKDGVLPDAKTKDSQNRGCGMSGAREHDLKQSWAPIARRLKLELGDDLYVSWFQRMEAEDFEAGRLTVSVPTRFLRNWIETHYVAKLRKAASAELGPVDTVQIKVRNRGMAQRETEAPRPSAAAGLSPLRAPVPAATSERGAQLDTQQTFANFVLGKSNAIAHAAAMRVADMEPGQTLGFNPLFVHSPPGHGKTHLLHAVAWRIREQHPHRRVMLMTAERFMVSFVQALRQRDTLAFKDNFSAVDVLLIDDFQFLQGRAMQTEFCHTFNGLLDAKRQIVVAADVPPAQLDAIDQRMRSRLQGGLVVDIEPPELELRRAIVIRRLETLRLSGFAIEIDGETIEFIANKAQGGGREIEGALNRIHAWQQINRGSTVTADIAAMLLRDMAPSPDGSRVRVDDILKVVGRHYNVARTDLLSPRRARNIVIARQVGMYLAKKLTPRSLPEIGRRFGGKDHSTVLHAVRKIEGLISTDERLSREVAQLIRLIEQGA
jgi:chromosomal replication initiator protein